MQAQLESGTAGITLLATPDLPDSSSRKKQEQGTPYHSGRRLGEADQWGNMETSGHKARI